MMSRWDNNRRCEKRRPVAGRISWSGQQRRTHSVGWLSDESESGVSFVTHRSSEPCCGDQVWVTRAKNAEAYQVTRVTEYGENTSLIGCRRA